MAANVSFGDLTPTRNTDRYACCRLPYYVTVDDGALIVRPDTEGIAAGWLEAVELNHPRSFSLKER